MTDADVRMQVSMYRGLCITLGFALYKIVLGFLYDSAWLFAMAGYHVTLSIMRLMVVARNTKIKNERKARLRGLRTYMYCGWLMMFLNVTITVIMIMAVFQESTVTYPMYVTIGLAAYTFYAFTMAIINMVRYRRKDNPVYSTVKCIEMAKAIVSLFTLQVAMLNYFNIEGNMNAQLTNALTGIGVAISIHTIGALMIHGSRKDINKLLQDNE